VLSHVLHDCANRFNESNAVLLREITFSAECDRPSERVGRPEKGAHLAAKARNGAASSAETATLLATCTKHGANWAASGIGSRSAESAPARVPVSIRERAESFSRALTEQHCGCRLILHIILADALYVENITHPARNNCNGAPILITLVQLIGGFWN